MAGPAARWQPLILLVDDSATHVAGVRPVLERAGYRVSVASSGRQGLELSTTLAPDVILMDVVMPDLNGFQATRKLARDSRTRHIPVVLASSKAQDSDRIWGLRQGAVAYLVKPFGEALLLETVASALDRAARTALQVAAAEE